MAAPVDHPLLGAFDVVGQGASLSRTPFHIHSAPPERGEHTDAILGELGYDAAAIAEERSLDPVTGAEGGDAGWLPRGALIEDVEETLFGLNEGDVIVYPVGDTAYFVYELLEKDALRPLESEQRSNLAEVDMSAWVEGKTDTLDIDLYEHWLAKACQGCEGHR